jgi:leucyl-tRNA synthetase
MEYSFRDIEARWREAWKQNGAYRVIEDPSKPKCYVLDMFPYPSGAGLHVGHPLGYIASDIYSRYKRLKGFNVLHPMGFDSFGLPAEQYAIETGQHPARTTEKNIATFKSQLDKIGFCYDWNREVRTSDPSYYKWTQWLFLKLFESWYNPVSRKAEPISALIAHFESEGSRRAMGDRALPIFGPEEWNGFPPSRQQEILMEYRLAFSAYGEVNWCEGLGTVLANDEVVNGVSERGGFPVEKKKMRQWYLRITAFAERLLEGLEKVEFSEAMKEMQRNWIGRSEGAEVDFSVMTQDGQKKKLTVYTTRPDTIFGVDFMVLAPEHELVASITDGACQKAVDEYLKYVKSRTERERMSEVKQVTGCFTGAYAENPFSGKKIPVYIAEYVLAGYGTGAIMAVPCGDQRDFQFAKAFDIPITNIIGDFFNGQEANPTKEALLQQSGFLDGMPMSKAIGAAISHIEKSGIGKRKVNYKMRDAGFSRQRYWGEPFPVIWEEGVAVPLSTEQLPLSLPHVDTYGPGPEGEGPLANLKDWVTVNNGRRETSTMPGYAGSSWYFLRYMDPHNESVFCRREASDYWGQVDVYVGGTEHAVGHLLYSRMWTKVFYDLGLIGFDEPFRKLINQGMIQGSSRFVNRLEKFMDGDVSYGEGKLLFISQGIVDRKDWNAVAAYLGVKELKKPSVQVSSIHVDVNMVDGIELDMDAFRSWRPDLAKAEFVTEDGKYLCSVETEKMSKSKFNTVNPDVLVEKYGADTFRMYEMFLGPVEQSKPWDSKGIEGVHRFLKKLWRLYFQDGKEIWNNEAPTDAELKVLHRTIRKVDADTEHFSFNTAVSAFMVCVNELADLKCNKKSVLDPLLIILAPYAPHIAEELWRLTGNTTGILAAPYPVFEEKYLIESTREYPVSVNGKLRTSITVASDAGQQDVEKLVIDNPVIQKWLEGKPPKKIIFVKDKMVNVVV